MASVLVFASSSATISPFFLAEARRLGEELARAGHSLVFGGANVGAMGQLADGAVAEGGVVVGIIPDVDWALGIVHERLSEKITVQSLAERKRLMLERAEIVIAFPGGLGTLDEVTDLLVLKQTEGLQLPLYFLNLHDYWRPFLEALTLMAEQRMIHGDLDQLYQVVDSVDELTKALGQTLNKGFAGAN